ncbi:hypothetical protein I4F81_000354 [Pyropia yezoensis]|uniref:Uncharacterized protein n=1 Tax=Pyropia yezoensis TaxID=2788 RepID=A0ACC3BJ04_PYRYE|nr:hypothetical protein I4F81_000354 [Neopyropia yezoensis]
MAVAAAAAAAPTIWAPRLGMPGGTARTRTRSARAAVVAAALGVAAAGTSATPPRAGVAPSSRNGAPFLSPSTTRRRQRKTPSLRSCSSPFWAPSPPPWRWQRAASPRGWAKSPPWRWRSRRPLDPPVAPLPPLAAAPMSTAEVRLAAAAVFRHWASPQTYAPALLPRDQFIMSAWTAGVYVRNAAARAVCPHEMTLRTMKKKYKDNSGFGDRTTTAMPFYDDTKTLLGVAGVDIPFAEIASRSAAPDEAIATLSGRGTCTRLRLTSCEQQTLRAAAAVSVGRLATARLPAEAAALAGVLDKDSTWIGLSRPAAGGVYTWALGGGGRAPLSYTDGWPQGVPPSAATAAAAGNCVTADRRGVVANWSPADCGVTAAASIAPPSEEPAASARAEDVGVRD